MVAIPPNTVTEKDVADWYVLVEQLRKAKAAEMLLRTKIFGSIFPNPVEGTNTAPFINGFVFKGVYKIDRSLDEGMYTNMQAEFIAAGFDPNLLVKRKPELVISAYRGLTAEQQKLFDQALISKPGAPALSVEKPKPKGKAAPAPAPTSAGAGQYVEQSDTGQ